MRWPGDDLTAATRWAGAVSGNGDGIIGVAPGPDLLQIQCRHDCSADHRHGMQFVLVALASGRVRTGRC